MPESMYFSQLARTESTTSHETSSQAAYVQELAAYTATIPDLSAIRSYQYPYSLSSEDRQLIGEYCSDYLGRNLKSKGVEPLYRDDIIDPRFCKNIPDCISAVTGMNDPNRSWYAPETDREPYYYYAQSNQAKYTSRQWERFFIGYMRQRRIFHLAYMQALIAKAPIDEAVNAISLDNGLPRNIPSADPNKSGEQPAPEFLYDKTNWLTASLLSVLDLPPEKCDAGMKRHAIEQWARHADLTHDEAYKQFYGLVKRQVVRLPWTMRSNSELQSNHHESWRTNPIIKTYLGELWQPRADGLETLLQERPKDYIQVLILQIFGGLGFNLSTFKQLAHAAMLPNQVKDVIFAGDAAFNTVFSDTPILPRYGEPTSLTDLLSVSNEALAPRTQEAIIEGQRLRIQRLTGELAAAQETLATQQGRIDELTTAYHAVRRHAMQLEEALRQQSVRVQTERTPRSDAEKYMVEFGIRPDVDNDNLVAFVGSLRRTYNKKLHGDNNPDPAAHEKLKVINQKLDDILRGRGLQKNQG